MPRLIGGVIAGIVAWIVVVTVLNLLLRHGWQDYAAVEKAMAFTVPMMIARLAMSGISSLAGGLVAARIGKGGPAPWIAGVILLLLFIPVHYSLWSRFPVWYHLTFLASLPLLSWAGGRFQRPGSATA
jgi:phosphatidylserine synthase